jgi:hypothetical protein
MGMYAVAAAIAFVGALWAGVPIAVLAPLLILLACPLMMIVMMSGMHGSNRDAERHDTDEHKYH